MTENLDFSQICRVCCLQGSMMSLFKVHISKKLMACSQIQVWPNDGLPSQICTKCVAKLHIAFQFKKQCEKSDSRLRICLVNQSKFFGKQQNDKTYTEYENIGQHPSVEEQNNYVYVECTPNSSVDQPGSRQYTVQNSEAIESNRLNPEQLQNSSNILSFSTPVTTLSQIPMSYAAVQNIPLPSTSLQYQTYNIPVQLPTTSQVITLGQMPSTPSTLVQNQNIQSYIPTHSPQLQLQNPQPLQNQREENQKIINDHSPNKTISYIKIPIKIEKEIEPINKNCKICGKQFTSATKLSRHLRTHSGNLPYHCNICQKGFSHSGNYKVHMRMHTNERPFKCKLCEKACRQQQDLEKHMRTHTGERPHGCSVCQKAFSTSSNLIAHLRIHTGEKPYVCSVCQKAFCQSNELTKHARTHTGEKSHICSVCNKGFNGSSTLIVHMRSHTKEKPYFCNICNKKFSQLSCLHVHKKRHKNVQNLQTEEVKNQSLESKTNLIDEVTVTEGDVLKFVLK